MKRCFINGLIWASLCVGLWACADTYQWIDPPEPKLLLDNTGLTERVDSIKTKFKNDPNQNQPIVDRFVLTSNAPQLLQEATFDSFSGLPGATVKIDGREIQPGATLAFNEKKYTGAIEFTTNDRQEASYDLSFKVRDWGGKTTYSKVRITLYEGLSPVARLAISKIREGLYALDASASYDRDKYPTQGQIRSWVFMIDDKIQKRDFIVSSPIFQYGFPKKGTYTITLVVYDEDGVASAPLTVKQIIE